MSSDLLTDGPTIALDLETLLKEDSVFASLYPTGYKIVRSRGLDGMAGLARIVIGQQVSTKAAQSMWKKFSQQFDPTNPDDILSASDEDFRSCGLSRQKISYLRGLAQAIADRTLSPERWPHKSSEEIISDITALKGFGLWSAQMFLMFNLVRSDVWPYGDLGIQNGLKLYLNLNDRPTLQQAKEYGALFKGRETAAALLLWDLKDGGI